MDPISIYAFAFVVIFNEKAKIEIPYDSMQSCYIAEVMVDKDPSRLYYTKRGIDSITYGCERILKRYVEECERLPMDFVNKKACIPYWEYYSENAR
jgi:hypothetical protein